MLFKFQLHEKKHPPHVSNIILVLDFIYAKHFQSSDLYRGQYSAKVLTVIRVHCNARLHRYYVVDDIRRLFIPSNYVMLLGNLLINAIALNEQCGEIISKKVIL